MLDEDLAACRRMRACLLGIRDLDPEGVDARLSDLDREIGRLQELLAGGTGGAGQSRRRLEVIPIGASVRAA